MYICQCYPHIESLQVLINIGIHIHGMFVLCVLFMVCLCSSLLQPCVCTRELCVFAFQTLGVMADAAEAIATDADVCKICST